MKLYNFLIQYIITSMMIIWFYI